MKNITLALSALALAAASSAYAEIIPGTNFSIEMQAAQLQANGRKLNLYRIPVKDTTTGITAYYDVGFDFGVLSDGTIGFTRTTSAALAGTQLSQADQFVSGNYTSSGITYQVTGPSALAGGRFAYSIQSTTANKTFNATWITGSVAGHPLLSSFADGAVGKPLENSGGGYGVLGPGSAGFDPNTLSTIDSYSSWISIKGCGFTATQTGPTAISITLYAGTNGYCIKTPGPTLTLTRQ